MNYKSSKNKIIIKITNSYYNYNNNNFKYFTRLFKYLYKNLCPCLEKFYFA